MLCAGATGVERFSILIALPTDGSGCLLLNGDFGTSPLYRHLSGGNGPIRRKSGYIRHYFRPMAISERTLRYTLHVRSGSNASLWPRAAYFRSSLNSRHSQGHSACLKSAMSGLMHRSTMLMISCSNGILQDIQTDFAEPTVLSRRTSAELPRWRRYIKSTLTRFGYLEGPGRSCQRVA